MMTDRMLHSISQTLRRNDDGERQSDDASDKDNYDYLRGEEKEESGSLSDIFGS